MTFSDDLDLFFPSFLLVLPSLCWLVRKLYRKHSVAGFSQEVRKRKLCCSNSLAISLVGQDVLNISVLRA